MLNKKNFLNILVSIFSLFLIFIIIEMGLRIKNKFVIDYDIEMWRYSKELKVKSNDKEINHEHKKNSSAILQNVEISINSKGMRGNDIDLENWQISNKKILFIGSSITLGWGVNERMVQNKILERKAKENNLNWATLNGGIGNYNTERYVKNFLINYKDLKPDVVILQYFINDAEVLNYQDGNFFSRNFHLGVFLWKYLAKIKSDIIKENIYDYYKRVYLDEEKSQIVKNNLINFQNFCKKNDIRCIIFYTPDLNLINTIDKLEFAKRYVEEISEEMNMEFFDLTYIFKTLKDKKLTNSEYKDRHPNSFAHTIFADNLYKYLVN